MSYLEKSTFWKRSIDWLLQLTVIPRIILPMYILNNQDSNAQFFFIISCVVSLDHAFRIQNEQNKRCNTFR